MVLDAATARLRGLDPGLQRIIAIAAVGLLVPFGLFEGGSSYLSRMFSLVLIFAIIAIALNIVYGHADVLFLFMGAMAGIGAYWTVLVADAYGLSMWVTVLGAPVVVGIVGGLVSYAVSRRRFTLGLSAIATLALQLSVIQALIGFSSVTGGSTGLPFSGLSIEPLEALLGLSPALAIYYVLLGLLLAVLAFYWWFFHTRYGVAYDMLRQDSFAAAATGVNVLKYQTVAGFISGFIVGIVGPFYAQLNGTVIPGMFEFAIVDVTVLIVLVLGGLRTMTGPVIGAVFIVFLEDYLGQFATWRSVIFGLLLIVLFLYFREGIVRQGAHLIERTGLFHRSSGG